MTQANQDVHRVALPPIGFGACNVLGASFTEVIDAAEHNGFRRITANPAQVLRAEREGATGAALRQRLDDVGITCTMLDALPGVLPGLRSDLPPSTIFGSTPAEQPPPERCFEIAEVLGIRLLNVTHYGGEPAVGVSRLADALAEVGDRAHEHAMEISLEFIPGTGVPDLATAHAVVRAADAGNVGILLDVFHHARSGGTVEDVRRLPQGSIRAVQLSDRIEPPAGSAYVPMRGRLLPGYGALPLDDLVRAALENSPAITVDVEVLNTELAELTPREVARTLAESLERWTSRFDDQ